MVSNFLVNLYSRLFVYFASSLVMPALTISSRLDLRPEPSNSGAEPTEEGTSGENGELPPPLRETDEANSSSSATESSSQPRGISRFIDLHRLRHAPAEERIAALRELRNESRDASNAENASTSPEVGASQEDVEESGRRARLTNRLKEKLRVRTRPMPPTTEE